MVNHPMVTITFPVQSLVDAEYRRAAGLHGALFASTHEGYGVIAEELQEASEEQEKASAVMFQLLKAIREEKPQAITDLADYIRDTAVSAAAEMIQVAAMCEKLNRTIQEAQK
jgi:hypothetical protein